MAEWTMDPQLSEAVKCFWDVRQSGGSQSGTQEGTRSEVIGGKHCDGFITLVKKIVVSAGINDAEVFIGRRKGVLPGYFRPTKDWDLVVVADGHLLASLEVKSQVGSLGNNCNNRAEEAVGNGYDFQAAFKAGAFKPSLKPWLGYFCLLEDCAAARVPVSTSELYFPVLAGFKDASYEERYRLLCERLVREGLYDSACFIMSSKEDGPKGIYREPDAELSFFNFSTSLFAKATAFAKQRQQLFPPTP